MKNFNDLINSAAASVKVEMVDTEKEPLTDEQKRAFAQTFNGIQVAFLLGGANRGNVFSYNVPVNIASGGGRASFDAVAIVPGNVSYSPTRSLGGTVKIGPVQGNPIELPYVRQVMPNPGFNEFPFTEDAGWEDVGENKILRWKYVFSFGPECIPAKSFQISFRGWTFYPSGSLPVTAMVYQSENPAGVQEDNGQGVTITARLQPTCEGEPTFQPAPPTFQEAPPKRDDTGA